MTMLEEDDRRWCGACGRYETAEDGHDATILRVAHQRPESDQSSAYQRYYSGEGQRPVIEGDPEADGSGYRASFLGNPSLQVMENDPVLPTLREDALECMSLITRTAEVVRAYQMETAMLLQDDGSESYARMLFTFVPDGALNDIQFSDDGLKLMIAPRLESLLRMSVSVLGRVHVLMQQAIAEKQRQMEQVLRHMQVEMDSLKKENAQQAEMITELRQSLFEEEKKGRAVLYSWPSISNDDIVLSQVKKMEAANAILTEQHHALLEELAAAKKRERAAVAELRAMQDKHLYRQNMLSTAKHEQQRRQQQQPYQQPPSLSPKKSIARSQRTAAPSSRAPHRKLNRSGHSTGARLDQRQAASHSNDGGSRIPPIVATGRGSPQLMSMRRHVRRSPSKQPETSSDRDATSFLPAIADMVQEGREDKNKSALPRAERSTGQIPDNEDEDENGDENGDEDESEDRIRQYDILQLSLGHDGLRGAHREGRGEQGQSLPPHEGDRQGSSLAQGVLGSGLQSSEGADVVVASQDLNEGHGDSMMTKPPRTAKSREEYAKLIPDLKLACLFASYVIHRRSMEMAEDIDAETATARKQELFQYRVRMWNRKKQYAWKGRLMQLRSLQVGLGPQRVQDGHGREGLLRPHAQSKSKKDMDDYSLISKQSGASMRKPHVSLASSQHALLRRAPPPTASSLSTKSKLWYRDLQTRVDKQVDASWFVTPQALIQQSLRAQRPTLIEGAPETAHGEKARVAPPQENGDDVAALPSTSTAVQAMDSEVAEQQTTHDLDAGDRNSDSPELQHTDDNSHRVDDGDEACRVEDGSLGPQRVEDGAAVQHGRQNSIQDHEGDGNGDAWERTEAVPKRVQRRRSGFDDGVYDVKSLLRTRQSFQSPGTAAAAAIKRSSPRKKARSRQSMPVIQRRASTLPHTPLPAQPEMTAPREEQEQSMGMMANGHPSELRKRAMSMVVKPWQQSADSTRPTSGNSRQSADPSADGHSPHQHSQHSQRSQRPWRLGSRGKRLSLQPHMLAAVRDAGENMRAHDGGIDEEGSDDGAVGSGRWSKQSRFSVVGSQQQPPLRQRLSAASLVSALYGIDASLAG